MGLEPQIVEKLKSTRRRARRQVILTRAPLLAGIAICAVMLALRFTVFNDSLEPPGLANWILLGVTGFLLAVSLVVFVLWFRYLRRRGRRLVETAISSDGTAPPGLKMFEDALQSVAIGAGVPSPPVLVSTLPTVNALPVHRDGERCVAFTEEAVREGLSFGEAEAMASQSLAKLIMGRIWELPVVFRSGLVPFFLLGFLVFSMMITLFAYVPEDTYYLVIVSLVGYGLVVSLGRVGRFLFYHGDSARCHNDALADSVAVKITGDPSTMKSLLEKLGKRTGQTDFTFELQCASRYLFLCPPGALIPEEPDDSEGYEEMLESGVVPPRVLEQTVDYGRRSLEARLENLAAIEKGRWPEL